MTRKIIFFSPSSYTLPFDSFSGGTLERADCPVRAGCRPGGRRGKRSKPCTHCRPQPTNLFVRPDPLLLFTYFLFDLPTEPTSGPIVRSVPIGPELLGRKRSRNRTHCRPQPTDLFVRPDPLFLFTIFLIRFSDGTLERADRAVRPDRPGTSRPGCRPGGRCAEKSGRSGMYTRCL